jgi:hypothetical protein
MQHVFTFLFPWLWMIISHPFHISLTEIRQNQQSKKLEIAQKIFWDDLEKGLKNFHQVEVDFLNPKDAEKLKSQVNTYLLSTNEIWIDRKKVNLKFLGYEIEEDAAWFYFESEPVTWIGTFEVKNTLLIDPFPEQQNIIHIYPPGKSLKSLLLGKGNEKGIIQ